MHDISVLDISVHDISVHDIVLQVISSFKFCILAKTSFYKVWSGVFP